MAGKRRRSARFVSGVIGAVVIVLSVATALFALNSSKGVPGVDHTYVTIQFTDMGDLRVASDLREADFRVGRVNSIEYTGNAVGTLVAQFDDTRPVFRNARAQVVSRSGLGQKYLNVQRGDPSAGVLEPYGTIPASQTDPSVEILDLATIFDPKTISAAQGAVEQLGSGLEGNGDALSQAVDSVPTNLPRLQTVVSALNQNNGRDVNTLLTSLRNLTSRFEGREQQLADLNRQLATTFDAVNVENGGALARLLQTAPPAFRDVRRALIDVQEPLRTTTAAVTNIRPGVRDLARATPDVRGVLREAPRPLDKVPGVSRVGQPALRELTPAARDLRPLVPKLRFALENLRVPLKCLAKYSDGLGLTFSQLATLIRQGDNLGNTARFALVPNNGMTGGASQRTDTNPVFNLSCPQPDGTEFATTQVQPPVQPVPAQVGGS